MTDMDEIQNVFEEHAPYVETRQTGNESLRMHPADEQLGHLGVEFTRAVGSMVMAEGYYISGVREHDKEGWLEVWFDEVPSGEPDEDVELTVAQKAASILREEVNESMRIEPNISGDPKRQYVDFYTDGRLYLEPDILNTLDDTGIDILSISIDGRFGADHRIWFERIEENGYHSRQEEAIEEFERQS